ncbi:MAG: InlB B-repeat-containing protein [Clostridia bacterium]|nr:InlB B-repeat-containing protein [Clostridia bacterium]
MKKRIVALLLTLALAVGTMSALMVSASAETPVPTLNIAFCNLSFSDAVYIKYAVDASVSDVKILIWTSPKQEYTVGTQDAVITDYYDDTIGGKKYKIFDYTKLAAKQMADVVYARAYAKVGNEDYYSTVNKYSILQYAYNKLGKTATASSNEELKELLSQMLAYGAAAQKYFGDYKVDRLATADWYQVKLTAGTLDDGCKQGLYLPGDTVKITAPATDAEGGTFAYWKDSNDRKIATTAEHTITVGTKNEVYTPVYKKYSIGLEFDSNGDGTCCVVGMGTCADSELVIPPVSPEAEIVIAVEGFAGEAITSVSFPSTIEEITKRAFNECTLLTDVYYDGTEEEWTNNVDIEAYNDAIVNATKHFNKPVLETFTVTFVDYDGTFLKEESVESGGSATAPAGLERENYIFIGWDKDFSNVTENMTVTAQYEISNIESKMIVSNATAAAGDENVEITVALENNPGIALVDIDVLYDSDYLTLSNIVFNPDFGGAGTKPKNFESPVSVLWYNGDYDSKEDAVFVTLIFSVSENAVAGDYDITLSCTEGDICNIEETNVSFVIENGKITVS